MLVFVAGVVIVGEGVEVLLLELVVVIGEDDLLALTLRSEKLRWKDVCFLSGQTISEKGRKKETSQSGTMFIIHQLLLLLLQPMHTLTLYLHPP